MTEYRALSSFIDNTISSRIHEEHGSLDNGHSTHLGGKSGKGESTKIDKSVGELGARRKQCKSRWPTSTPDLIWLCPLTQPRLLDAFRQISGKPITACRRPFG